MANWMLSPQMLSRMVCMWLPTGVEALAWEDPLGDVFVQWAPDAHIQVAKHDRLLSMDAVTGIYKPQVDAKLIETWTLVEDTPHADQWSAEEMASRMSNVSWSINKIRPAE